MSIIDISKHIEHVEGICKDKNLNVIIFDFIYEGIKYKCFYRQSKEVITMAPVGYNFAANISFKGNQLDNYLEKRVYLKLRELHRGKLKTKVFCRCMLDAMLHLTTDMVLRSNWNFYAAYKNRIKNIDESRKVYFFCWSRSHSGRKPTKMNLAKTRAYFGEEVYLICKINNVSSRWKHKPKKTL